MSSVLIGNFLIFVCLNAFTPGPSNILALNTVTNYGIKRGCPLYFGIFAGYYLVQLLCAVFVFSLSALLPEILEVLKYLGALYIVWLAVHIALSKPEIDNSEKSASFWRGFILQFVNVKIWLLGITALSSYIVGVNASFFVLAFFEIIIATIGVIATMTWIGIGTLIQSFYLKHARVINIVLALLLLECVYSILTQ